MTSPLSEQLRQATKQVHAAAESAPFMRALLSGRLSLASYRALLANLRAIYSALESELARLRVELAGFDVAFGPLARTASLDSDLDWLDAALGGPAVRPLLATEDYVEHLRQLGRETPQLLIAHAYVRYLGDLYGGQLLAGIVGRTLRAPAAFYDFGPPDRVSGLIRRFRQALDGLALGAAERAHLVAEAQAAFERHVAIFGALEAARADDARPLAG